MHIQPLIEAPPEQTEQESYLYAGHYDLVTPDGAVTKLTHISPTEAEAEVFIQHISPAFVGFDIDIEHIFFNIKSVIAQAGLDGYGTEYSLDKKGGCAQVRVRLKAIDQIGAALLKTLPLGTYIGKLFAADQRRRVRDPDYLSRMFGRSDRKGRPLLSLGGMQGSTDLILDKVDGRTIAYLSLRNGTVAYNESIHNFLPSLTKGLCAGISMRDLLRLHQQWIPHNPKNVKENELLLVRTLPLHIRTVFAKVVPELLAEGYQHTTASVLQPDTSASGDIYELFGSSIREITDIPLEFYTLEPHREYIFFEDRDQLKSCLEDNTCLFEAFKTAPEPQEHRASVFIVKGKQLLSLKESDWIIRDTRRLEFPGVSHATRHALMIERYIRQQPSYHFLKAIEDGLITSQGILLTRYLSSPLMKRMFLSNQVQRHLKGIYFQRPSQEFEDFFSQEDRALLHDLAKFAIPVYWVDESTQTILQYIQKPNTESGMFVPLPMVDSFLKASVFGVYGSNLIEGNFEEELTHLLKGILDMRKDMTHDLLNPKTPLVLVTGGGPGAMEVGNRVATQLNILSCGCIVDFRSRDSDSSSTVHEQEQNPHVQAKMTYRLDRLVERQAEFNLDFPIFLTGGIGTDFEFCLEEVRRKVGYTPPTPIILFGDPAYWKDKITYRFQQNLQSGTIQGSEWISNCFYCIRNASQGLKVYRQYFEGKLPIGKKHPYPEDGFVTIADD